MTRYYKEGRPYSKYVRNTRVTCPSDVKPGQKLIMLSHQFQAENLIVVAGPMRDDAKEGFYYQYAAAPKHPYNMAAWSWEVNGEIGQTEFWTVTMSPCSAC